MHTPGAVSRYHASAEERKVDPDMTARPMPSLFDRPKGDLKDVDDWGVAQVRRERRRARLPRATRASPCRGKRSPAPARACVGRVSRAAHVHPGRAQTRKTRLLCPGVTEAH